MEVQSKIKLPEHSIKPLDMNSIFRPRRKRANDELPDYCNCVIPQCVSGPPGSIGLPGVDGSNL